MMFSFISIERRENKVKIIKEIEHVVESVTEEKEWDRFLWT